MEKASGRRRIKAGRIIARSGVKRRKAYKNSARYKYH